MYVPLCIHNIIIIASYVQHIKFADRNQKTIKLIHHKYQSNIGSKINFTIISLYIYLIETQVTYFQIDLRNNKVHPNFFFK